MVRLTKLYTRTGDRGTTGLSDGSRVSKASARVRAIGDVDEANSAIGLAIAALAEDAPARATLARIQNELFDLGADLATPGDDFAPSASALRVTPAQVERLEGEIDAANEGLGPLRSFILPGGSTAAAALHVARATCRRAERQMVEADGEAALNPAALAYVNRLSDLLFVLARTAARDGGGEVLWVPGASRG